MEEIDDQDTDKSLDDKFRRITKIFILLFLLAFFYNNVKKMDRVAFELWWLCCKYIQKNYQKDKKFFIKIGMIGKRQLHIFQNYFIVFQVAYLMSKNYSKPLNIYINLSYNLFRNILTDFFI